MIGSAQLRGLAEQLTLVKTIGLCHASQSHAQFLHNLLVTG